MTFNINLNLSKNKYHASDIFFPFEIVFVFVIFSDII